MSDAARASGRSSGSSPGGSSVGCSVDEVRERTDVVEVISQYVALKRAGKTFKGLCPFHAEQAPSFTVNPEKQLWYCFGCQAGGNVFHFLMKMEGLTFTEAAERLARRAGLQLQRAPAQAQRQSERDLLAKVNVAAARFYREQLRRTQGTAARAYLAERGLTEQTVERFGIGLALDEWEALWRHLRSTGHDANAIARSGLVVARAEGEGYYDRFRNRVMFPIIDIQQRVIGFGGRTLGDDPAKYMNSSESALFVKGRTLYALPQAAQPMQEKERAILVEGYFDCVVAHQYGFTETVATLGTALTADHAAMLRRRTERVYVAFDADSAGAAATIRARPLFDDAGVEVRVVALPRGVDPDSFLRAQGADSFEEALRQAPTMIDWQLRNLVARYEGRDEEGRLGMTREAVPLLSGIADRVARAHYVKRLAEYWCGPQLERVSVIEEALHQEIRRSADQRRKGRTEDAPPSAPAAGRVEREVLAAMLQDQRTAERVAESVAAADIIDPCCREIFERVLTCVEQEIPVTVESLVAELSPQAATRAAELAIVESTVPENPTALASLIERMQEARWRRRYEELRRRQKAGELSDPQDPAFREYYELRRRYAAAVGRRAVGEN
jgi:DNA primase